VKRPINSLLFGCILVIAVGCTSVPERNPLPERLGDEAAIPGIDKARHWADEPPPWMADLAELTQEEIKERFSGIVECHHNYLAISGGGPRGAFGAGLLCGWTEAGTRPEFSMVTGVSTGALIAPFAFLGPKYDHVLRRFYTEFSTDDILEQRSALDILLSDAAADSTPLQRNIANFVDEEVVADLATEHAKGRALVIVTTNLDAGRPVAWDIDRIAASGDPNAVQLIRDIMLASASIPGAFPPVMFTVEAEGMLYDEMHVDGGATTVVYLYPIGLDWEDLVSRLDIEGRPDVYMIRNGYLKERWVNVERSTISIAVRTVDILMGSAAYGDMYRIFLATQRDGLDYHLAYIPEYFDMEPTEAFDPKYMTALFDLAYEMGKNGYEWKNAPPGYDFEKVK
jgi:predicted acylesterase/phospholipase RssA